MMARGRTLAAFLALSILANAFCIPVSSRLRREYHASEDSSKDKSSITSTTSDPLADDDDDDDFGDSTNTAPSSGGGSNIFSLLNLASALFPASNGPNVFLNKMLGDFVKRDHGLVARRDSIGDNTIDIDYPDFRPLALEKQELEDSNESSGSDSESTSEEDSSSGEDSDFKANSKEAKKDSNSKQDISIDKDNGNDDSNGDNENSSFDSDEPPEGDGQGGGVLGFIAGLTGGEESDLATLLSTAGGLLASLSGGDDFDLNNVLGSVFGLLAGLLSQGEENPGSILANYILTTLETITDGGANNNGAFFGSFISKLIKGISMGADEDGDAEKKPKIDSAGFILSFITGLLGDMSKGSSSGSS